LMARDEESELCLEGRPALAFVKRTQERVVLRLGDALRVQGFRDDLAKGALADSDRAFDCDVAGWFEKVCHGSKTLRTAEYLACRLCAIVVIVNVGPSFPPGNAAAVTIKPIP